MKNKTSIMDILNLSTGIYLIKVGTNQGSTTKKTIKE